MGANKKLTPEQREQIVAERLAGRKEGAVARSAGVTKRHVRRLVAGARKASTPEEWEQNSIALRERLLAHIDSLLQNGIEGLQDVDWRAMKPVQASRVLADVARVRRDIAAAPVPGNGETPSERMAREAQPVMPVLTEEEWARQAQKRAN